MATLHNFATNKTSGYERESAAIAFQSFAAVLGPPAAPVLLPSLPTLFDLYMDKGEVVRQGAAAATKAILKLFPPESTRLVFKALEGVIENGKWRTKAGALDAMRTFVNSAEEAVATELATILPAVTAAMHDTKNEVCHKLIVQSNVR
jgi:elongation factor 3